MLTHAEAKRWYRKVNDLRLLGSSAARPQCSSLAYPWSAGDTGGCVQLWG